MQVTIIAPNGIFHGNTTDHKMSVYPSWFNGVETSLTGQKTMSCFYKSTYFTGYLPNIDGKYWSEKGNELLNTTVFCTHEL